MGHNNRNHNAGEDSKSSRFSFFHRAVDGAEVLAFSAATVAAGTTTLALGVATAALTVTGIGIPIALLTGALTVGAAAGTVFSGSKVHHKAKHVAGKEHDDESCEIATSVLTLGHS